MKTKHVIVIGAGIGGITAAIHLARQFLRSEIAARLKPDLEKMYESTVSKGPYLYNAAEAGRRRLRNVCLAYLAEVSGLCPVL